MSENIENASVVAAVAARKADAQQDANGSGRGYLYTATEDLMVAKAFIRASEDRIKGSKQKVSLFKAKLASNYLLVKKEQENFEQKDAQHWNHLRIFNANNDGRPLDHPYPARMGNSIYQHFKWKIQPDVIKFISIRNKNPKLSGENDDDTYHIRLSKLFKECKGCPFRFLHCYIFLKDKPKCVALMQEEQDKKESAAEGRKRKDVVGVIKAERPLGSKAAKRMAETVHHFKVQ